VEPKKNIKNKNLLGNASYPWFLQLQECEAIANGFQFCADISLASWKLGNSIPFEVMITLCWWLATVFRLVLKKQRDAMMQP
jgi:hypothetical protein